MKLFIFLLSFLYMHLYTMEQDPYAISLEIKGFSAEMQNVPTGSSSSFFPFPLLRAADFLRSSKNHQVSSADKAISGYCRVYSGVWNLDNLLHCALCISCNAQLYETYVSHFRQELFYIDKTEKRYFNFAALALFFSKMSELSFSHGVFALNNEALVPLPAVECKKYFASLATVCAQETQSHLEWTDDPYFTEAEIGGAGGEAGIVRALQYMEFYGMCESDRATPTAHVYQTKDNSKQPDKITILLNWKNVQNCSIARSVVAFLTSIH